MFIIVLGQHVSILTESSSGPSKKTDPYLEMFKMRCGFPNAYILHITIYKIHVLVLFLLYSTIRIPISKTDCTIRTKRHMHFIHSYIENVSVWDPTAHFKHF